MAAENAEFGSQKLPTTVPFRMLQITHSVSHFYRGFLPHLNNPKCVYPPLALGALFAGLLFPFGRNRAPRSIKIKT
jgi:hypothetical protein